MMISQLTSTVCVKGNICIVKESEWLENNQYCGYKKAVMVGNGKRKTVIAR